MVTTKVLDVKDEVARTLPTELLELTGRTMHGALGFWDPNA